MKKTDAYWRDNLSSLAYQVTRKQGTERPFTGVLNGESRIGTYVCICCGSPLFESDTKFNAGCGWPSFFRAVKPDAVREIEDRSHGMMRTEIRCSSCDAHLGHVFPDGPPPTGLRYCMNSVSMKFITQDGEVVSDG